MSAFGFGSSEYRHERAVCATVKAVYSRSYTSERRAKTACNDQRLSLAPSGTDGRRYAAPGGGRSLSSRGATSMRTREG